MWSNRHYYAFIVTLSLLKTIDGHTHTKNSFENSGNYQQSSDYRGQDYSRQRQGNLPAQRSSYDYSNQRSDPIQKQDNFYDRNTGNSYVNRRVGVRKDSYDNDRYVTRKVDNNNNRNYENSGRRSERINLGNIDSIRTDVKRHQHRTNNFETPTKNAYNYDRDYDYSEEVSASDGRDVTRETIYNEPEPYKKTERVIRKQPQRSKSFESNPASQSLNIEEQSSRNGYNPLESLIINDNSEARPRVIKRYRGSSTRDDYSLNVEPNVNNQESRDDPNNQETRIPIGDSKSIVIPGHHRKVKIIEKGDPDYKTLVEKYDLADPVRPSVDPSSLDFQKSNTKPSKPDKKIVVDKSSSRLTDYPGTEALTDPGYNVNPEYNQAPAQPKQVPEVESPTNYAPKPLPSVVTPEKLPNSQVLSSNSQSFAAASSYPNPLTPTNKDPIVPSPLSPTTQKPNPTSKTPAKSLEHTLEQVLGTATDKKIPHEIAETFAYIITAPSSITGLSPILCALNQFLQNIFLPPVAPETTNGITQVLSACVPKSIPADSLEFMNQILVYLSTGSVPEQVLIDVCRVVPTITAKPDIAKVLKNLSHLLDTIQPAPEIPAAIELVSQTITVLTSNDVVRPVIEAVFDILTSLTPNVVPSKIILTVAQICDSSLPTPVSVDMQAPLSRILVTIARIPQNPDLTQAFSLILGTIMSDAFKPDLVPVILEVVKAAKPSPILGNSLLALSQFMKTVSPPPKPNDMVTSLSQVITIITKNPIPIETVNTISQIILLPEHNPILIKILELIVEFTSSNIPILILPGLYEDIYEFLVHIAPKTCTKEVLKPTSQILVTLISSSVPPKLVNAITNLISITTSNPTVVPIMTSVVNFFSVLTPVPNPDICLRALGPVLSIITKISVPKDFYHSVGLCLTHPPLSPVVSAALQTASQVMLTLVPTTIPDENTQVCKALILTITQIPMQPEMVQSLTDILAVVINVNIPQNVIQNTIQVFLSAVPQLNLRKLLLALNQLITSILPSPVSTRMYHSMDQLVKKINVAPMDAGVSEALSELFTNVAVASPPPQIVASVNQVISAVLPYPIIFDVLKASNNFIGAATPVPSPIVVLKALDKVLAATTKSSIPRNLLEAVTKILTAAPCNSVLIDVLDKINQCLSLVLPVPVVSEIQQAIIEILNKITPQNEQPGVVTHTSYLIAAFATNKLPVEVSDLICHIIASPNLEDDLPVVIQTVTQIVAISGPLPVSKVLTLTSEIIKAVTKKSVSIDTVQSLTQTLIVPIPNPITSEIFGALTQFLKTISPPISPRIVLPQISDILSKILRVQIPDFLIQTIIKILTTDTPNPYMLKLLPILQQYIGSTFTSAEKSEIKQSLVQVITVIKPKTCSLDIMHSLCDILATFAAAPVSPQVITETANVIIICSEKPTLAPVLSALSKLLAVIYPVPSVAEVFEIVSKFVLVISNNAVTHKFYEACKHFITSSIPLPIFEPVLKTINLILGANCSEDITQALNQIIVTITPIPLSNNMVRELSTLIATAISSPVTKISYQQINKILTTVEPYYVPQNMIKAIIKFTKNILSTPTPKEVVPLINDAILACTTLEMPKELNEISVKSAELILSASAPNEGLTIILGSIIQLIEPTLPSNVSNTDLQGIYQGLTAYTPTPVQHENVQMLTVILSIVSSMPISLHQRETIYKLIYVTITNPKLKTVLPALSQFIATLSPAPPVPLVIFILRQVLKSITKNLSPDIVSYGVCEVLASSTPNPTLYKTLKAISEVLMSSSPNTSLLPAAMTSIIQILATISPTQHSNDDLACLAEVILATALIPVPTEVLNALKNVMPEQSGHIDQSGQDSHLQSSASIPVKSDNQSNTSDTVTSKQDQTPASNPAQTSSQTPPAFPNSPVNYNEGRPIPESFKRGINTESNQEQNEPYEGSPYQASPDQGYPNQGSPNQGSNQTSYDQGFPNHDNPNQGSYQASQDQGSPPQGYPLYGQNYRNTPDQGAPGDQSQPNTGKTSESQVSQDNTAQSQMDLHEEYSGSEQDKTENNDGEEELNYGGNEGGDKQVQSNPASYQMKNNDGYQDSNHQSSYAPGSDQIDLASQQSGPGQGNNKGSQMGNEGIFFGGYYNQTTAAFGSNSSLAANQTTINSAKVPNFTFNSTNTNAMNNVNVNTTTLGAVFNGFNFTSSPTGPAKKS